jgi:5-dehydro-2-deoxygluconokinase
VRYANAAGAIVAGRLMCADDMPTAPEIDELIGVSHG